MNPALTKGFLYLEKEDFARAAMGADIRSLDIGQLHTLEAMYKNYLKSGKAEKDVNNGYKAFESLSSSLGTVLTNYFQQYDPSYKFWDSQVEILEDAKKMAAWDWDQKIDGETQDMYDHRDMPLEGESQPEFLARIGARWKIINDHN